MAPASQALDDIGDRLDEVKKDKTFLDALDKRETSLRESSTKLADTLAKAQEQLAARPETGLEKIAKAYEDWLTSGGMKSVLDKIEAHFKESPDTGGSGRRCRRRVERPRATVEIKELLIELDPAADIYQLPVPEIMQASLDLEELSPSMSIALEKEHELKARGFTWAPGALITWS